MIAEQFSNFSSSTGTRCQDSESTTPQSATLNIPSSETRDINRSQLALE